MVFMLFLLFALFMDNTGLCAETVFVKTGASVQLDIQTQEIPEFYTLVWSKDKSDNIITYLINTKVVTHVSYKDRVDFNTTSFSLTLKNMQKNDAGLYTAHARGQSLKTIATHRVSVIGLCAETVFVKTGASVQLDIQTQEIPQFHSLVWSNDKSDNIVSYFIRTVEVEPHISYKDRVDFNTTSFSLTLKNMQKNESGLYTAQARGKSDKTIATHRVSVIDEVEDPSLAVNSNWSSPDSCGFTCTGSNSSASSIFNDSSCSPQEVTSADNSTLRLSCSDDIIMCNYSNPVSSKTKVKKVHELCSPEKGTFCIRFEL